MPVATIGSETFITIGELEPIQETSEIITRPNVDGVSIRKSAKRGSRQRLVAVKDIVANNGPELKTIIDDFIAMAGTTVTIVTNGAVTRGNIYIERVRIPIGTTREPNPQKVPLSVGGIQAAGTATHVIRVEFSIIDTSLSP